MKTIKGGLIQPVHEVRASVPGIEALHQFPRIHAIASTHINASGSQGSLDPKHPPQWWSETVNPGSV
jgi:hypothetical protein